MTISTQIPYWQVVAASVCGTSHVKNSQLCQDAHHWQTLPDSVLLAAAADGAGSARLGKIGSMVAVETAIKYISTQNVNREILEDEAAVLTLLRNAIEACIQAVEEEAVSCDAKPQDLATTLIITIATPEMAAVAQIGDGMAVAKDLEGNLIALTTPDRGEYINQTTFLTTVDALDTTQVKICRQTIVNVGILTDGLQMLAMNMAAGEPHNPFFSPLFDFVNAAEDQTVAREQLVKFLCSDKITQRTDDDLTLILAALNK
ncbi:MAG: PP2C family serine/threonine-protein phosphatase [Calothrix sp. MO_167.B12]|nr:PP2C family serine/threonine-protein phosphatase [Calothrix sp. MO_167.B12]